MKLENNLPFKSIVLAALVLLAPLISNSATRTSDANKKTVAAFYNMAFNLHQPKEAMEKYVGEKYVQHNPFVADGKQPFIDFFLEFYKKYPAAHTDIKRILADGDLVVVHTHSKIDDHDLGRAVMDIFRIENGKIVEHWDVSQNIPEKSANDNTMF
jgi:predicted SnoaL-like aldol condensation-catalyzing enzyme